MPAPPLYPLRFQPIFKPAIWGGRRLAEMFPGAPPEGPIGEAWVLSDHGDDVSVVADGPLKGTTLRELMRDRREELLGPSLGHHDTFPLLLKFIDARENLSVQVHPDDGQARKLTGVPRGKTEAWYVLHTEPGSRIYAGLKAGVDRPRLERAIADGKVADCLHSFEPTVGDCVYLPAGTVHALGGGITIFEVQQTCDTTYRLFDWNRVDARTGRPRALHVEQALACTDFKRGPVLPSERQHEPATGHSQLERDTFQRVLDERRRNLICWTDVLVDCPHFTMRQFVGNNGGGRGWPDPGLRILVGVWGTAEIRHSNTESVFGPFQVTLIPTGVRETIDMHGKLSVLEIQPK